MVSSTDLPFQNEFDDFNMAQLWVICFLCVLSFVGPLLMMVSVAALQSPNSRNGGRLFSKAILGTMSFTGICWSAFTFMAASHEVFIRLTDESSSDGAIVFLGIVAIFHEWVEWASWILTAWLAYSLVNKKVLSLWSRKSWFRILVQGISFGIPISILIPTAVLNEIQGARRINGISVAPLCHGILLVIVVIIDCICFAVVSLRLRKSFGNIQGHLTDSDRLFQRRQMRTRDIRFLSFLIPFVVCWTVPTYLSFREAVTDSDPSPVVNWLFVLLTPSYFFLNFLVYSHGRYYVILRDVLRFVTCGRYPFRGSKRVFSSINAGDSKANQGLLASDTGAGAVAAPVATKEWSMNPSSVTREPLLEDDVGDSPQDGCDL
eukprot:ANDGO_03448.mRNA.1 hypothetical protein